MRVELQDDDGAPIDGFSLEDCDPIYGDQVDRFVTWQRRIDLSELAGKPIRMFVELNDADLYSFRFSNLDSGSER